jgi:Holliday junction resolvase
MYMTRYNKGANAERELMEEIWSRGFAVARIAGSGKNPLPMPDLIALDAKKKIAFECKAWKGLYLNISHEQIAQLKEWCARAGAEFFIAWKVPHKGWLFLSFEDFAECGKSYAISLKKASSVSRSLDVVLGKQAVIL